MGRLTEAKAFLNEPKNNSADAKYLDHHYKCIPITPALRKARLQYRKENDTNT